MSLEILCTNRKVTPESVHRRFHGADISDLLTYARFQMSSAPLH